MPFTFDQNGKLDFNKNEDVIVELTFNLRLAEYITDEARDCLHEWLDFLLERNMSEFSGVFVIDRYGNGEEITHV